MPPTTRVRQPRMPRKRRNETMKVLRNCAPRVVSQNDTASSSAGSKRCFAARIVRTSSVSSSDRLTSAALKTMLSIYCWPVSALNAGPGMKQRLVSGPP